MRAHATMSTLGGLFLKHFMIRDRVMRPHVSLSEIFFFFLCIDFLSVHMLSVCQEGLACGQTEEGVNVSCTHEFSTYAGL